MVMHYLAVSERAERKFRGILPGLLRVAGLKHEGYSLLMQTLDDGSPNPLNCTYVLQHAHIDMVMTRQGVGTYGAVRLSYETMAELLDSNGLRIIAQTLGKLDTKTLV